jgi:hypothetical protein
MQNEKKKRRTLLPNKRQTPRKRVHKVGQPIRVCRRIVLPNRNILVGIFQYSPTIMVHIQIVWRGEDSDDRREVAFGCFAVHGVSDVDDARFSVWVSYRMWKRSGDKENDESMNIPCILCFMSADESEQPIPIQELADGVVPSKKEPRSVSYPPEPNPPGATHV